MCRRRTLYFSFSFLFFFCSFSSMLCVRLLYFAMLLLMMMLLVQVQALIILFSSFLSFALMKSLLQNFIFFLFQLTFPLLCFLPYLSYSLILCIIYCLNSSIPPKIFFSEDGHCIFQHYDRRYSEMN